MDSLTFVSSATWDEVFASWREGESHLPHWIEHYKGRGYDSWDKWRQNSSAPYQPESLEWRLYNINDLNVVQDFYGGPFRAWQKKYYGDKPTVTFRELAQNLQIQADATIAEIIKNFPNESALIGLRSDNKIYVIEGMHRCAALALAKSRTVKIETKLTIYLAEFDGEIPALGQENSPA